MVLEINQQTVTNWIKTALASSGPVNVWVLAHTGITASEYDMDANIAAYLLPPIIVFIWSYFSNLRSSQIANVAKMSADEQAAALNKVDPGTIAQIAEKTPGIATVVVEDAANGKLQALAASEEHKNIVTAAQNEHDAKNGKNVP